MKLGYLHIGPPEHGVCRYGRLLAAEARRRPDLEVTESDVLLTGDDAKDRQRLIRAARELSHAGAVHFQFSKFNRALWGDRWTQARHLTAFLRNCSRPLVVTLHDVYYPPYRPRDVLGRLARKLARVLFAPAGPSSTPGTSAPRPPIRFATLGDLSRKVVRSTWSPEATTLRKVIRGVDAVLTCTHEESRRLQTRVDAGKLEVIPHFVEGRSGTLDRGAARKALGLEGVRVVTLMGFIYPYKGHELLVEALPHLPEDVRVIFAGGTVPRYEGFVHGLAESARAKGVADRLRITGYLSETDLERVLFATDLAVCPFSRMSASSSISSWISVGCPILASDLPQVAEYNRLQADAIRVFRPHTALALAEAVRQSLMELGDRQRLAVTKLARRLSVSAIFDQHLKCYRRVADLE